MFFDLPLPELREYRADLVEPTDFDAFWRRSLADAEAHPLDAHATLHPVALSAVDVFDVAFTGFGGQRVAAWLYLPRERDGLLPAVVEYVGYGGGRGSAHEHLLWSALGYAHLYVDTRGQGSAATGSGVGDTADDAGPTGPHVPGFLTSGIESPERYYYRRVFIDAVRAVRVLREHPAVDPAQIVGTGASQGGGIALAVAGLTDDLAGVMPDVPFLCDFRRAAEVTNSAPYQEIVSYCAAHRGRVDAAFETLSYFDGVSFAARASAPALFSVALMDQVCPPSTVFAAYNAYAHAIKDISVYQYNGHEGGGAFHRLAQMNFRAELAGRANGLTSIDR